jgi:predicted DNA-binding transcriptional regulator AlpA
MLALSLSIVKAWTKRLQTCFSQYRKLTGSAEAAATLVLAQVQSGQRELPQPTSDKAEFLTVKQAAEKYNIGERTIYRLVEDGLPVTRVGKAESPKRKAVVYSFAPRPLRDQMIRMIAQRNMGRRARSA